MSLTPLETRKEEEKSRRRRLSFSFRICCSLSFINSWLKCLDALTICYFNKIKFNCIQSTTTMQWRWEKKINCAWAGAYIHSRLSLLLVYSNILLLFKFKISFLYIFLVSSSSFFDRCVRVKKCWNLFFVLPAYDDQCLFLFFHPLPSLDFAFHWFWIQLCCWLHRSSTDNIHWNSFLHFFFIRSSSFISHLFIICFTFSLLLFFTDVFFIFELFFPILETPKKLLRCSSSTTK